MHRSLMATLMVSLIFASGACNRDQEKMRSTSETQAQAAQPANTPITVEGCVKAGDAADTFVLTTARTEGGQDTVTYQLVGEQTPSLRDHVGRRVEVSGMMEAQQEIASRTTAQPKEQRPTGTSGTPTVQTRAEIDIKRLSVKSVKGIGGRCD
jgi:hypothetical protein